MARTQKIKIINILLSSVDGKIAKHPSESTEERRNFNFTNSTDFTHLRKITASCDAVFIGAKSIESEAGAFRVSDLRKTNQEPPWYVFTKSGNVNQNHPFWAQKGISKNLVQYSDINQLRHFLEQLSTKNINKIALLGGGKLNGLFWENNLVDELYLTISPFMLGSTLAPSLLNSDSILKTRLKLLKMHNEQDFLFLHYKVCHNEEKNSHF